MLVCQWGQGPANRSLHVGGRPRTYSQVLGLAQNNAEKHILSFNIYPSKNISARARYLACSLALLKMPGNSSASGSKPGFGNALEIENWLKPYVSDPGFMSMYPADRSYAKRDADTLSSNNFEKMVREGSYNLTKIYRPPNHLLEDV